MTRTARAAAVAAAETKGKGKDKGKVAGKGKARAKKRKRGNPDSDSDSDDDDEDADADWAGDAKPVPAPGQIAFCAACDGRFTVTIYSRLSEDGDGLLCSPCGRKMAKQDGSEARKKGQPAVKRAKRKALCLALDGETMVGPKSLKEYCIRVSRPSLPSFPFPSPG